MHMYFQLHQLILTTQLIATFCYIGRTQLSLCCNQLSFFKYFNVLAIQDLSLLLFLIITQTSLD